MQQLLQLQFRHCARRRKNKKCDRQKRVLAIPNRAGPSHTKLEQVIPHHVYITLTLTLPFDA